MTQVPAHIGKKKVLVTGGAGFIGSWVADTLLARGDDVVIVDEVCMLYSLLGFFYTLAAGRFVTQSTVYRTWQIG